MSGATSDSTRPAVDARLVASESRYEVWDGRVKYVAPADEPHAVRHSKVSALLEAHVAEGYEVASDMLTRTSASDDMAPDASVFPSARDPETGRRQLEELAFEIASTEALSEAGRKAQKLVKRGVRRVFAIDLTHQRAVEWSELTDSWRILDRDSAIEDRALAAPLPIRDLVTAARADDAMARALLVKRNPVLLEALGEEHAKGKLEGKAEGRVEGKLIALLAVLGARGLAPTDVERRELEASQNAPRLDAWLTAAAHCASIRELLGG